MTMEAENQAPQPMDRKKVLIIAGIALAVLALVIALWLILRPNNEELPTEPATEATTEAVTEATTEAPTEATTEPQMLAHMKELYDMNPDVVGWLTIEDTKVDYPVMHTPDDGEKYLHMDFDGKYDFGGELFIEDDCSMDPESDNLIIYGHNMKNGTMFRAITEYRDEAFWQDHKTMTFSTLYEERTYEVVAAFYDRVYLKSDTCFKFYQFIDAETEEDFNEAIEYYKANDRYETGVMPQYGDKLLTLVTCTTVTNYDDGRFVVIAREVPAENVEEATEVE